MKISGGGACEVYPLAIKDDIQVVAVGSGDGGIASLMSSSSRSHGRSANNRTRQQQQRGNSNKIYDETEDNGDGDRIEENGRRIINGYTNGFYATATDDGDDRNNRQQQQQQVVQLESDDDDQVVEDELEDLENLPLPPSPVSKVRCKRFHLNLLYQSFIWLV